MKYTCWFEEDPDGAEVVEHQYPSSAAELFVRQYWEGTEGSAEYKVSVRDVPGTTWKFMVTVEAEPVFTASLVSRRGLTERGDTK